MRENTSRFSSTIWPNLTFLNLNTIQDYVGLKKCTKTSRVLWLNSVFEPHLFCEIILNHCARFGCLDHTKTSNWKIWDLNEFGFIDWSNLCDFINKQPFQFSRTLNITIITGVTKNMQEVLLDSKIKLLDSPGMILASGSMSDSSIALRNAIKVIRQVQCF